MRIFYFRHHITALLIALAIVATSFFISALLTDNRIQEIRSIEDKISMDILSAETQFALLELAACEHLGETFLSQELRDLSQRLSYMEQTLGLENPEVVNLKKYYSLLQIKDYLLMQRAREKCEDIAPISIVYFYSNKGGCRDCIRQGHVLSRFGELHEQVRIYAFDYHLAFPAIQTLVALYEVEENLPALLIGENVMYGYLTLDDLYVMFPDLLKDLEEEKKDKQEDTPINELLEAL
ncbi:MAG: hypothetical protein Q8P70_02095 [bacterium]|nr:hypothetical protein [bacterium]